jgi:hypothetical protein
MHVSTRFNTVKLSVSGQQDSITSVYVLFQTNSVHLEYISENELSYFIESLVSISFINFEQVQKLAKKPERNTDYNYITVNIGVKAELLFASSRTQQSCLQKILTNGLTKRKNRFLKLNQPTLPFKMFVEGTLVPNMCNSLADLSCN